jgi:hypothetical protein
MKKLAALAATGLVLFGLTSANVIGTYDGLNKGVFVGHCGLEVVGEPGFFCNYEG